MTGSDEPITVVINDCTKVTVDGNSGWVYWEESNWPCKEIYQKGGYLHGKKEGMWETSYSERNYKQGEIVSEKKREKASK